MHHVFISSTSIDLQNYRQAAIDVCMRLGLHPIAMEFFESMGKGSVEGSLLKLKSASVYVGIFAHRYGYIEPGQERSVTEMEFDAAETYKLERLCFLVDPAYPWPPSKIDYTNEARLKAFKSRVDSSVIRSLFSSVDDFALKLMQALVEWMRRIGILPIANDDSVRTEPSLPPAPARVLGREKDLTIIKSRLGMGSTRHPMTIIRGWPGVGKTTLINHLVYDPDLTKTFEDGLYWIALGTSPDAFALLSRWARTLGINPGSVKSIDELMNRVRDRLRNKRALLIVDDVWDENHASYFNLRGVNSSIVFTTRFKSVADALQLKPDDVYVLPVLSPTDAFQLFAELAPRGSQRYPDLSRQLVQDLEGLPLAICVAARLVENEAGMGEAWDMEDFFKELREEARLLEGSSPEDRFDPATGTTPSIARLLQQSIDCLDVLTRDRFAMLGSLAPKPAMFELEAIRSIWLVSDARPTVRRLVDRGLLEAIPDKGLFQMHALLVMHAKSLLDKDDVS